MPDSYFYGNWNGEHICGLSDNFWIGGISYFGSQWPLITQ